MNEDPQMEILPKVSGGQKLFFERSEPLLCFSNSVFGMGIQPTDNTDIAEAVEEKEPYRHRGSFLRWPKGSGINNAGHERDQVGRKDRKKHYHAEQAADAETKPALR